MLRSQRGFFYGDTTELIRLEGVTLTDTIYSRGKVDWHFHEDDYFTFLLTGGVREGNRKEVYECEAPAVFMSSCRMPGTKSWRSRMMSRRVASGSPIR